MRSLHKRGCIVLSALAAGALLVVNAPDVRADGPFQQLAGAWTGSGQVRFEQGSSEQIACKAYYNPKSEGSDLALAIRCASSTYKIEMRANLNNQAGRVTGRWEERTFNAEGSISGRATGSNLSLDITGPVSGTISVVIGASGHRVDIKTSGTGLAGVSISLSRA